MKRTLLMGMLLGALVGSWVIWLPVVARAVICTPLGSFTTALSLCKPLQGEVNWAAAINANWDILDNLFDPATGRIKAQFGGIPSGVILMIDSGAAVCPTGFTEVTTLRGRYPRGMLAAGETIGNTVGTALTASENRPAGSHTHTTSAQNGAPGGSGGVPGWIDCSGSVCAGGSLSLTSDGGGLITGTPAPYEVVMFCKKT